MRMLRGGALVSLHLKRMRFRELGGADDTRRRSFLLMGGALTLEAGLSAALRGRVYFRGRLS